MKNMGFLGVCYVYGNTFDAWSYEEKIDINDRDWETRWGSPRITQEQILQLKSMGFKTIKLPITWHEHFVKQDEKWVMQQWWIDRITEVVQWILDAEMYCIINTQHDADFINNGIDDYIVEWFTELWRYLSIHFKDCPEQLIFESMNEVGLIEWEGHEPKDAVNYLNKLFLETVRETEGNNKRILLVEGHWADIRTTRDLLDKYDDDNYAIAIHFYTPGSFTIPKGNFDFTKREMINALCMIDDIRRIHDVDIVITECGCNMDGHEQSKVFSWYKKLFQYCHDNKIALSLWTNGDINEEIIDRRTMTYLLKNVDTLIDSYNAEMR